MPWEQPSLININVKEADQKVLEQKFWDKLVHLGWRCDGSYLVLVCSKCEKAVSKIHKRIDIDHENNTTEELKDHSIYCRGD